MCLMVAAEVVAPLVGAWIEIVFKNKSCHLVRVAPLVGAWIEINNGATVLLNTEVSLLSWERGLKLRCSSSVGSSGMSLLSWARGLKSAHPLSLPEWLLSLLSWERGLKFLPCR